MDKQRWEDSGNRKAEERRSEKRKSQKKEDAGARKGRKVANRCVFLMICGPGESRSRLAKAAGAEPSGRMRDEKLHAVVARSTFRSQKGKRHFTLGARLEVEMSKSARCCGAKHISKSKCTEHTMLEALLQVEMLKNAHTSKSKCLKTPHARRTFGSTFGSEKSKKADGLGQVRVWVMHKGFGTLPKVSKNVKVLWRSEKRWHAWDT